MTAWREYQEEVASFFRSIGLNADTDLELGGVRTAHRVDVVVRARHVGFDLLWIVECKHWQSRVSKLHVFALREIVSELGADRGLLMTETGFQSGAHEAAQLTNVSLTSLADLRVSADHEIGMAELRGLQERVDRCKERYWALPKDARIAQGLRPDVTQFGYSGARVIAAAESALSSAFRGKFPIEHDSLLAELKPDLFVIADTPTGLFAALEPHIEELERLLGKAENVFGRQKPL